MRKPLALLIGTMLCLMIVSASADVYFYNPDGGSKLHADPLCRSVSTQYLPLSPIDTQAADTTDMSICSVCATLETAKIILNGTIEDVSAELSEITSAPAAETAVPEIPAAYYYNPDGGSFYHQDPECSEVAKEYRPLHALGTVNPALLDLSPCAACVQEEYKAPEASPTPVPVPEEGEPVTGVLPLYLKSMAEKAELLPGIWTLPGAEEISMDTAAELALDAICAKFQLTDADCEAYQKVVLHTEFPHGDDLYRVYRVCLMKAEDEKDLSTWQLFYEARVDGDSGEIMELVKR